MTDDRKKQIAWMLTSVCHYEGIGAVCPFHAIDPYGETLCPAGKSEKCFNTPCKQMTMRLWLKWMDKEEI